MIHVVHGIRISDIPWLNCTLEASLCGGGRGKKTRVQKMIGNQSKQDDRIVIARRNAYGTSQIFYRFMFWLYSDFINPLLSSCFYATEAEGSGSKVLFYRKPVWSAIVQRGQRQLQQNFIQVRPLCIHVLLGVAYFLSNLVEDDVLPFYRRCIWMTT